ncbi:MAG: alpha/beta fold hydrolase [Candidatus Hydrogenedentota bacterium]
MHIRSEKIAFRNSNGEEMAGRLKLPIGTPRAYALFAHCFTCSKETKAATAISRGLAARGFAVLHFDFTGLGESEGDFANAGFSSNVADIVAAAHFLEENYGAPDLLVGHSLGGTAVLAAQRQLDGARAVCTIGAPAAPAQVKQLITGPTEAIHEMGETEVTIAGRSFRVGAQFLRDLEKNDMATALLGKSLLIMHSPKDEVVPIQNAERIYQQVRGLKSFITLENADHLLTNRADADYAAHVLAAWAMRYLPPREDRPEPPEGDVAVAEWDAPYTNRVVARDHMLLADEPRKHKGLDAGPTPYEYLLGGLGACTSMTLRMYAERKQLPLDHVRVDLNHKKMHAKDCSECVTEQGKVDHITRRITLTGDLTEDQRDRLLEIADKCPVHRTLTGEIRIDSELAG